MNVVPRGPIDSSHNHNVYLGELEEEGYVVAET